MYPFLLACLEWIPWGTAEYRIGLLHIVLGVATVWATWRLGKQWGLPPAAALVAAGLVTVDPLLLGQSLQTMTETLATFLATIAMLAITRAGRDPAIRWTLLAGVLLGLSILCRPTFLAWSVLVVALLPIFATGPRRWLRTAMLVAASALTLTPWVVRNEISLGRPIVTTTHGGFTLLLANNPDFYEYLRSGKWGSVWDGKAVYREVRPYNVAELEHDRQNYRQAFKNIRAEPGMFAWSCLVRLGRLWNVLPHQTSEIESTTWRGLRYAVAIWYAFVFALAAIGAWFLRGKLFTAPWLWGTLLVLSITLVHAFYWTDMRMRAPLTAVIALAAAQGLVTLACRRDSASASPIAA